MAPQGVAKNKGVAVTAQWKCIFRLASAFWTAARRQQSHGTGKRRDLLHASPCLPPAGAGSYVHDDRETPMDIAELTSRLHRIRDHNDWRGFHSPKNLTMAASVEMAELVEIFQWLSEDQSRQLPAAQLSHAGEEVGDIVLYLLLLCAELGIDLEQAVRAKLADSERRFVP